MTQCPPPLIDLRRYRLSDVPHVAGMLKASWHSAHDHILGETQSTGYGRRIYSRFALTALVVQTRLSSRYKALIATKAAEVAGLAVADIEENGEIILYMLYVHPDHKRAGVGSALLHGVVAAYPRAKSIRLEVLRDNATAVAWYTARGFESYGELKRVIGSAEVTALYMDKKLEPNDAHTERSRTSR